MAERYTKLYTLESALYAEGAPVIIAAGALLDDSVTRRTLVQLKFKSVSDREISAVRVTVTPAAQAGQELGGVEYQYTGLSAARDDEFGQKAAIVMPEGGAASFRAAVTEVLYADGAKWDGTGSVWAATAPARTLAEGLGGEELARQYAIRYGSDCTTMPGEDRGLWYCACGAVNRLDESKCHSCRRVYSAMKNVNVGSLKVESAQRVQTEKQIDAEEQAGQKAARKKLITALAIIVPLVIAAVIVLCTVPRQMQQKEDYAAAVALLDSGKYDEAEAAFTALGNYADAEEQAKENVPYAKAAYVMDCAEKDDIAGLLLLGLKRSDVAEGETVSVALYREAEKLFAALGDYRDSKQQCEKAQQAVEDYFDAQKKDAYDAAGALLEDGHYCEARDAFIAMGSYKDSAEMAQECMYRRAELLYGVIDKYFMAGVAANISDETGVKSVFYIPQASFAELGNGVSSDIRDIFRGDGVEINIQDVPEEGFTPVCEAVCAEFTALGDYKDSAEMAQKSIDAGDFTKPFYDLCANGDIIGAYNWLNAYTGEFDMREQWLNLLSIYAPYCNTWELYQGDPTLIAQTVGLSVKCTGFTSKVIIGDTTARLVIMPAGAEDHAIELAASIGSTGFMNSSDGSNTYYAVISNLGRFTYTKYNSLGLPIGNQSCEYTPIG